MVHIRTRAVLLATILGISVAFSAPHTLHARSVSRSDTKFGIYYLGWHCTISDTRKNMFDPQRNSLPSSNSHSSDIRDITNILGGAAVGFGQTGELHWWGQPEDGYYCLSDDGTGNAATSSNDALLQKHAEMLRDAGVDFIFWDESNEPWAPAASDPDLRAFERLLAVWSTVTGAPKVAIWAQVPDLANETRTMRIETFLNKLDQTNLGFQFKGHQLVLVVTGANDTTLANATVLQNRTIRTMVAFNGSHTSPDLWGFMEQCGSNFKSSGGAADCGQRVSLNASNKVEAVSVTAAYQAYHSGLMSDASRSVPKFRGRTFRQQFKRAFDVLSEYGEAPEIVTMTGWNEWIAQRGCTRPHPDFSVPVYTVCDQPGDSETLPGTSIRAFADKYDVEYNRDIEPANGDALMGRHYYNLMKSCIAAYKANALCELPIAHMNIDTPANNSTLGPPFTIAGWAVDLATPSGTGVNAVTVWAFPNGGGSGIPVGAATLGGSRPDIAALYGSRFQNSGFSINTSGLPAGSYAFRVSANSTVEGVNNEQWVTVTIPSPNPQVAIDTPANNATVSSGFVIAGWAVDLASTLGTGIDTLHVWAYPSGGGSPTFLGAVAYGGSRPDVGTYFSNGRFTPSGYSLTTASLTSGAYLIAVFPHSTVSANFASAVSINVTVQ